MRSIANARWPGAEKVVLTYPGHTRDVFRPEVFRVLVDTWAERLVSLRSSLAFEALAGCGNSGVPLVAALSYRLGIPFTTVRKPGEETRDRTASIVTGAIECRYLVFDDFIASGQTVRHVMDEVYRIGGGIPAGICLYSITEWSGMDPNLQMFDWRKEPWQDPVRVPVIVMAKEHRDSIRALEQEVPSWLR